MLEGPSSAPPPPPRARARRAPLQRAGRGEHVAAVPRARGLGLQRLRVLLAQVAELHQVAPLVLKLHARARAVGGQAGREEGSRPRRGAAAAKERAQGRNRSGRGARRTHGAGAPCGCIQPPRSRRRDPRGGARARSATVAARGVGARGAARRAHLSTSKSGSLLIFSHAPRPCFFTPSRSAWRGGRARAGVGGGAWRRAAAGAMPRAGRQQHPRRGAGAPAAGPAAAAPGRRSSKAPPAPTCSSWGSQTRYSRRALIARVGAAGRRARAVGGPPTGMGRPWQRAGSASGAHAACRASSTPLPGASTWPTERVCAARGVAAAGGIGGIKRKQRDAGARGALVGAIGGRRPAGWRARAARQPAARRPDGGSARGRGRAPWGARRAWLGPHQRAAARGGACGGRAASQIAPPPRFWRPCGAGRGAKDCRGG
jgi:hypothetical protein